MVQPAPPSSFQPPATGWRCRAPASSGAFCVCWTGRRSGSKPGVRRFSDSAARAAIEPGELDGQLAIAGFHAGQDRFRRIGRDRGELDLRAPDPDGGDAEGEQVEDQLTPPRDGLRDQPEIAAEVLDRRRGRRVEDPGQPDRIGRVVGDLQERLRRDRPWSARRPRSPSDRRRPGPAGTARRAGPEAPWRTCAAAPHARRWPARRG